VRSEYGCSHPGDAAEAGDTLDGEEEDGEEIVAPDDDDDESEVDSD